MVEVEGQEQVDQMHGGEETQLMDELRRLEQSARNYQQEVSRPGTLCTNALGPMESLDSEGLFDLCKNQMSARSPLRVEFLSTL